MYAISRKLIYKNLRLPNPVPSFHESLYPRNTHYIRYLIPALYNYTMMLFTCVHLCIPTTKQEKQTLSNSLPVIPPTKYVNIVILCQRYTCMASYNNNNYYSVKSNYWLLAVPNAPIMWECINIKRCPAHFLSKLPGEGGGFWATRKQR